ncbi:very short patch repair endonuclease [Neorhizobium sp. JUb45]|uniref:very short patch repair endonuclease n=1 Tax=Neorhizobium sp. JUb45 TaxID=2485113 RepID=UPI00104E50FA|nr:very short patch repair endonuclease [Neorhizobium sp. JUb45]
MDHGTPTNVRSHMAAVPKRSTSIELLVRKPLHRRGLRYRLNVKNLPGSPDIVLPRFKAAIFVHGCYWHGHDCGTYRRPKSNQSFWDAKFARNRERDQAAVLALERLGWRVKTVWGCELSLPTNPNYDRFIAALFEWVTCNDARMDSSYEQSPGSARAGQ